VPYPRISGCVTSYAPLFSKEQATPSVLDSTLQLFSGDNFLVNSDPLKGVYMAYSIMYRGDVAPKAVNSSINIAKSEELIKLVDWSGHGFMVGNNSKPPLY